MSLTDIVEHFETAGYADGSLVHDSHAEVLARRCAIRFCYHDIQRIADSENSKKLGDNSLSPIFERAKEDVEFPFRLRSGLTFHFYSSHAPCGDASMFAYQNQYEKEVYTSETKLVRGRDFIAEHGHLRTKPGRRDAPQTPCLSCRFVFICSTSFYLNNF